MTQIHQLYREDIPALFDNVRKSCAGVWNDDTPLVVFASRYLLEQGGLISHLKDQHQNPADEIKSHRRYTIHGMDVVLVPRNVLMITGVRHPMDAVTGYQIAMGERVVEFAVVNPKPAVGESTTVAEVVVEHPWQEQLTAKRCALLDQLEVTFLVDDPKQGTLPRIFLPPNNPVIPFEFFLKAQVPVGATSTEIANLLFAEEQKMFLFFKDHCRSHRWHFGSRGEWQANLGITTSDAHMFFRIVYLVDGTGRMLNAPTCVHQPSNPG